MINKVFKQPARVGMSRVGMSRTGMSRVGIILLLVLALQTILPVFAHAAPAETSHGFTLTAEGYIDFADARTGTFTHDKTGATVYYIAADDENLTFDITFRTPSDDDRGTAHILEHIVLSGSEKYPSHNLFFSVAGKASATYINAMTYNLMTTYPLSSMSQEQLLKLADFYLDGVFNPYVLREERIFLREAWRYELDSADAPLRLTGTVLGEMMGADNIASAAHYQNLSALFPKSAVSRNSGGNPDDIPELTYDELVDFHEKYYHPSNCIVTLCGPLDLPAFLELLDGYFSEYDEKDFGPDDIENHVARAKETAAAEYPGTGAGSVLTYTFAPGGEPEDFGITDRIGLSLVANVLSAPTSLLSLKLYSAFPTGTLSVSSGIDSPVPYLSVSMAGVENADSAAFKRFQDTVDSVFMLLCKNGLDRDTIETVLSADSLSNLLFSESPSFGVELAVSNSLLWAVTGKTTYLEQYSEAIQAVRDDMSLLDSLLARAAKSGRRAATLLTPSERLYKQSAAEQAERLIDKKAAMKNHEILKLVDRTSDFKSWLAEQPDDGLLSRIILTELSLLPSAIPATPAITSHLDGTTHISPGAISARAGGAGTVNVIISSEGVPSDDLMWYGLYSRLLGRLDTENFSVAELQSRIVGGMSGFSVSPRLLNRDGGLSPVLTAAWSMEEKSTESCFKLVNEILFRTDFSNPARILAEVTALRAEMGEQLARRPWQTQLLRAQAAFAPESAYLSTLYGIEFYSFLCSVERRLSSDPAACTEALNRVQKSLCTRKDSLVISAGFDDLSALNRRIPLIFDGASEMAVLSDGSYSLTAPPKSEAIISGGQVCYNLSYSPLDALGLKSSGKLYPLAKLVYDKYLIPKLRHGAGAYDSVVRFDESGLTLMSYRDPSVGETFEIFRGIAGFLRNSDFTQAELDEYIIGAVSSYAAPEGRLSRAINGIYEGLAGVTPAYLAKIISEMKSFCQSDLWFYADFFDRLADLGAHSTSGSPALIGQSGLYDNIIDLNEIPAESDRAA